MGMSASQARYISLTARQNDTEYEAQQVNQERLTLTNKMNEVYEALVNMDVPTPPSKIDFMIENYAGKINGVDISVRRNDSAKLVAYEVVEGLVTRKTSGTKVVIVPDDNAKKEDSVTNSTTTSEEETTVAEETTTSEETTATEATTNSSTNTSETIADKTETKTEISTNQVKNYQNKIGTVSDIPVAEERGDDLEEAFQALKHSNPDYSDEALLDHFQLVSYEDGTYAFVLRSDYEDNDKGVAIFEIGSGKYEQEFNGGNYEIQFNTNGRVNSLKTSGGDSTILETEQRYDELKYSEAEAQYKYDKSVYDQEQNRLNHQTSIFQRQDKQLELKLTRLDSERNALNTELEAVKKVIQDSIDKGFKTFSG